MPTPLDESISAGQSGHLADHERIADAINGFEAASVYRGGVSDYVSTLYTSKTTGVITAGVMRLVPIYLDVRTRFDRIAGELATASANSTLRLGIYAHDDDTGRPSTLILDAGTIDGTGSTGVLTITIDETLEAGTYWLACASQGAGAGAAWRLTAGPAIPFTTVLNATNVVNSALVQTGVTGSLPDPAVVSTANLNGIAVQLRRALDP